MESEIKVIKEYLRCMNGEKACTNCYINEIAQEQDTCCINLVADMALDLINELESENESCHEVLADLKTIIKQQNDRIAELENEIRENAFYSKGYADGIKNTYEVVMPDKLKQFAEMLKENITIWYPSVIESIDDTLKEFIGE